MIRWSFLITRTVIVIAIIMLLRWGLGPVAGFVTVKILETSTGSKVDLASAEVGLFPPSIVYNDLQVSDPRDGRDMQDAFRAESMEFTLDGDALLHRRWVAREGKITGIQIGSKRETSGKLDKIDELPVEASAGPSMLSKLLSATTDRLTDEASNLTENLETVRRSREIRDRWDTEYKSLVVRARNLEKQIRTVRDEARGIDNPLRDWPQLQRTLEQARQARSELMAVRQAIDSLPEQLQSDLASLDEAKKIDMAKVEQYLPDGWENSENFGVDLLKRSVGKQVSEIRGYLDSGREIANYTVVAPQSERIRGEEIDLVGDRRLPALLVRHCEVSGFLRADGETYQLQGFVENMTPTPRLLREPGKVVLQLEGPEVIRVEYLRDRRRGADVDMLTLHWPQTEAKPMRLGNDHDAGLRVSGGNRELWVQLRSEGDQVQGRFVSKQTGIKMQLAVNPKYAQSAAAKSVQASLDSVDRIEVDANFRGQWDDLALDLHSNLGQVFHRATEDAFRNQLAESQAKLKAKVDQAHLEQTVALREWLSTQQSEARSLLASADKSIEEMSQKVMNEVGDADVYLGKLRGALQKKLR